MSPNQQYLHGRLPEALACWGAQLASGRTWTEVEAEIIDCCQGRVDLLTELLIEAETIRQVFPRVQQCSRFSGPGMPRYAATSGASS
jgi:hypothetical protein